MSDPNPTPAQQEFNDLVAHNASSSRGKTHPEDRDRDSDRNHNHNHNRDASPRRNSDLSEEDAHRAAQIDAAMRLPRPSPEPGVVNLPDASFDSGHSTGVKGVIADARSYQAAKKSSSSHKWRSRVRTARRSIFGLDGTAMPPPKSEGSETDEEPVQDPAGSLAVPGAAADPDEDAFLEQWREARRRELEGEAGKKPTIKHRRTSPSIRGWGRLDDVDALGYLDAIEKVRRDAVVVVFVSDPECAVSATVEAALRPLVFTYPAIHFVKIVYDAIEFDPAAVPALLAYTNQGDLFANLTGIVEMISEDEHFDTESLRKILRQHKVLP